MGLLDIHSQDIADSFNRQLRDPGPPPAPASFSAWAMLSAGGKAPASAGLESAGSTADFLSGFGTTLAATGISGEGMFSTGSAAEKQQAQAASKRLRESDAFDVSAGNVLRRRADEFAPNPETAHKADLVVHGLVRGVSKAVFDIATTGPVVGPILFGIDEGNTATQRLRSEGVDTKTAAKVGAVTGAVSAVSAAAPMVGPTAAATLGLGLATGPVAFMGQEKLTRDILQKADYGDLAEQHDPTDPLGLALSTVLPLAIGGVHIRGLKKRAAAVKGGGVSLDQMTATERVALKFNDPRLDAYAEQAAVNNGVPPAILLGIKNAGEKSNSNQTSPAGAKGVMQFMPATAKEMGLTDVTDPAQSIDGAARYLRKLHDAYGSWDAAVAHYNGGGAQAAIVRGGGKPTFPETAAYLERVKKYAQEHTSNKGAADPAVVDAARVKVTDDALMRSMPEHPEARSEVLKASDEVAAGRMPEVLPVPHTALPEFKAWFGDSKVVDEVGKPRVVYHGTTHPFGFDSFDPFQHGSSTNSAISELGFFFAEDAGLASRFAKGNQWRDDGAPFRRGAQVMPVHLSIKNPMEVSADRVMAIANDPNSATNAARKLKEEALRAGHDGLLIEPFGTDHPADLRGEFNRRQFVAFEPEQIKSAIGNSGKFDRNSASLTDPLKPGEVSPRSANALPHERSVSLAGDARPSVGADPGRLTDSGVKGEAPSLDTQRVQQIATDTPNLKVRLPGSDETITVVEAMARAKDEAANEASEANLIKAAFECAMGFGA